MYTAFIYVDGVQFDAKRFLAAHGAVVGGTLRLSKTGNTPGQPPDYRNYWTSDKIALRNLSDDALIEFVSRIARELSLFKISESTEVCLVLVGEWKATGDAFGLFIPTIVLKLLADLNGSIDVNNHSGQERTTT
jgi:hypothetical protein